MKYLLTEEEYTDLTARANTTKTGWSQKMHDNFKKQSERERARAVEAIKRGKVRYTVTIYPLNKEENPRTIKAISQHDKDIVIQHITLKGYRPQMVFRGGGGSFVGRGKAIAFTRSVANHIDDIVTSLEIPEGEDFILPPNDCPHLVEGICKVLDKTN